MSSQRRGSKAYQDEETLYRLYWDEGLSVSNIAGRMNTANSTILYWMDRHGIPRREQAEATRAVMRENYNIDAASEARRVEYASYIVSEGYEIWKDQISGEQVRIHQLLAIADGADPHEVFADETNCHHSTHHSRDNRPGVVEVMTRSEHMAYHMNQDIPEWKRELEAVEANQ